MNKLLIIALIVPASLFTNIDGPKLATYLIERTDESHYNIKYVQKDDLQFVAFQMGYFSALLEIASQIQSGRFDKKD